MSTQLTQWEQQLAQKADQTVLIEQHMTSDRKFLSVNPQTQLMYEGLALHNNEAIVVIADYVIEQTFYPNRFDADNVESPACYAFGRDENQLRPHKDVVRPISETCKDCPNYAWSSSLTGGKGKACNSRRRLAVFFAGTYDKDNKFRLFTPEEIQPNTFIYLRVPVTSVRNLSKYVTQLAVAARRPPFAAITKISSKPNSKTRYELTFDYIQPVPKEWLESVFKRNKEAENAIDFPYLPLKQQQGVSNIVPTQPSSVPHPPQIMSEVQKAYYQKKLKF